MTLPLAAVLGGAVFAAACSAAPQPLALDFIDTPHTLAGSAPRLTSSHGRVLLSWIETGGSEGSLRFAERTADGWSTPHTIVTAANLLVNSADVPSVLALSDGSLAAHWMVERGTGPESYDVQVAWSADGISWSDPVSPHDDGTESQHGFVSLFEPSPGALGLVWLDGRDTSWDAAAGMPAGDMALRAAHFAPNHRRVSDTVVDSRVCECCPTSATDTGEGVLVAYRGRSAANVRDIQTARFQNGSWGRPETVHDDGWTLSACPVNGPSIDALAGAAVVGWFTLQEAAGRAFVAFSSDAGRTFAAPIRVDEAGARGRLQVAMLDDGSAAVAWIEYADRESRLRLSRAWPDGTKAAGINVAGGMATQHPRMVRGRGELLLAWVERTASGPVIRTASAPY